MKYRQEIDGLRAIALLPVIFFHAGFSAFSGGFVGVDIFFVISGYLITTILIEDIENDRFNILNFYERRARRIFPALFIVMLVCLPFAWFWMLPDPLENFGQSLVANSFFLNNILLYLTAGYWDSSVEYKPLLHTWSLAVEEQYYVFFPIWFFLTWRFFKSKNTVFRMILILAFLSLMLSEWGWRNSPTANFYLAPTRAWELFAGGIAAHITKNLGTQKNNMLSLLGLVAILVSIFSYDETTPIPSVYALLPVGGTVLILLFGSENTLVTKILSNIALTNIGLISYSAYLWHQPLLSFAKIYFQYPPNATTKIIIIAVVFLLSTGTWKFIEKPFRDKAKFSATIIFTSTLICISFFSIIGFWLHFTNGAPGRIFTSSEYSRSTHELKMSNIEGKNIDISNLYFNKSNKPNILIVGDSFASDIGFLFSYYLPFQSYRIFNPASLNDTTYKPSETICDKNLAINLKAKNVDTLIFAYDEGFDATCIDALINQVKILGMDILFIGTKNFGYNLNWILREDKKNRADLCQKASSIYSGIDKRDARSIPPENYVSLMNLSKNLDCIKITNSDGELLASDLKHFTIAGVEYFAPLFFANENIIRIINK